MYLLFFSSLVLLSAFPRTSSSSLSLCLRLVSLPWLALPFDKRKEKEALSRHFGVQGIPTLVTLDEELNVVVVLTPVSAARNARRHAQVWQWGITMATALRNFRCA